MALGASQCFFWGGGRLWSTRSELGFNFVVQQLITVCGMHRSLNENGHEALDYQLIQNPACAMIHGLAVQLVSVREYIHACQTL